MNAAPGSTRRIGIGIGALAVAALTLTGCAAGQRAQTAAEVPVVDGVSANAGPIALRAVTVAAPPNGSFPVNGDAPMQLVIVNGGKIDDKLIGVSTIQASQVLLFASSPNPVTPGATQSESASGTDSSSPPASSDTALPTETASTPGASSPPAAATIPSINLPVGRATSIGYTPDLPQIQLHGLASRLFPAETFPITFQFAIAGSVTFTVAVHLTTGPSSTPTMDISPTAAG